MAERIGGTEEKFVSMMNKKSKELAKEKEIDKYYKPTDEDKEKIINEINEMLKK